MRPVTPVSDYGDADRVESIYLDEPKYVEFDLGVNYYTTLKEGVVADYACFLGEKRMYEISPDGTWTTFVPDKTFLSKMEKVSVFKKVRSPDAFYFSFPK